MIRKHLFPANLILISLLLASCSSLGGLFQSDPVGTTLFAMKSSYEGSVKSVGNAYIAGQITDAQLKQFVGEANKFYMSYNQVLDAHRVNKLTDPDAKIDALQALLDKLQLMVTQMLIKKPTASQLMIQYIPYRYAVRI